MQSVGAVIFGCSVSYLLGKMWLVRHPIGLRKPGTEEGKWTGAFVAGAGDFWGPATAGYFVNGLEYIAHHDSYLPVLRERHRLLNEGWKPMTREDMTATAGILWSLIG